MKNVKIWKEENGIVKQREFKVMEVIFKETYVIFKMEDGTVQAINNFKNFVIENLQK